MSIGDKYEETIIVSFIVRGVYYVSPQRWFLSPLWVRLVWVALFSYVYWFWILITLRTVLFISWCEGRSGVFLVGWVGGAYFWVKIWLFQKLFGSCLRSIWTLFKAFKAYFLVYLQLGRLINDPELSESSLSIVGPLGLSGSLFLALY